jgi:hypothetical protein
VLGGAALGIVSGLFGTWASRTWPLWRKRHAPALLALLVLVCAGFLAVAEIDYPLARPLQWAAAALGACCAILTLVRPGVRPA